MNPADRTRHLITLLGWQDTPIDRCQRHARYVEASQRIRLLESEIERMEQELEWLGAKNGP